MRITGRNFYLEIYVQNIKQISYYIVANVEIE